jgi:predicted transcriptional regulator
MMTKENVLKAMQSLPDDAHIEDAMERLLLLAKIEKGLEQADACKTIPHDQVREKMAQWLK